MKKAVCLLLVMLLILATCACAAKGPASVTPNSEESQSTSKEDTGSTDVPDESQENAVTVADLFGKFEPAIDITTMMLEDNIRNVPDNMTMESNPWIDLFKEYGINVTYKISGSASDLDTKLNMAIATDDLPDIMQVSATQFQELSEAGYLADLTEVFEAYATPETKAMFMQDGGIMMGNGYVNGKLVGLVMPQGYQDFIPIVYIRSDWLEECGLSAPQTMDELWNIAKTFKEKNMGGTCTIGIGMTKNVLDLLTPTIGLLNGYHAYYNIWTDINAKDMGVAQNRNRCFCVSVLGGEAGCYRFPESIPLTTCMADYLDDIVDEKYYINTVKAQQLIDKLISEGKLEDVENG